MRALRRSPRGNPGPGVGGSPLGDSLVADEAGTAVAAEGGLIPADAVLVGTEGKRRGRFHGLSLGAWLAIGWVTLVVLLAVLAKTGILTWGDPQNVIASCARKGPFSKDGSASGHLLGCDSDGRDMMARLALGAWTSLLVSVGAIALGFIVGGGLGIVAGYFSGQPSRIGAAVAGGLVGAVFGVIIGGVLGAVAIGLPDVVAGLIGAAIGTVAGGFWGYHQGDVDTYITNTFNVLLSVPSIVLALALVAFLQGSQGAGTKSSVPDVLILIIAIGIVSVPLVGRIARASALTWTQREFVLAAKAQGAKNWRIMWREVLPNVAPAMFSIALLGIAIAIVAEGTLAILGVGVHLPTPSWGNIIAGDLDNLSEAPHIVFESSILIFITVLALNYLGDVVRARFDVREAGI